MFQLRSDTWSWLKWKNAETRGTRSAGAVTSKCTFKSRETGYPFAGGAGAESPTGKWSGEEWKVSV